MTKGKAQQFQSGGFPGSATCFKAGLSVLDIVPRQQHMRNQVLVTVEPPHPQETSAWFMARGVKVHQASHCSFAMCLPSSMEKNSHRNLCCDRVSVDTGPCRPKWPPCDPACHGVACGSETWIITRGVFYTLSHK